MELHKCLRESEIDVGVSSQPRIERNSPFQSILLQGFPHTSDPPNGDTFLFNIEKLTTNEEYMIRTCCKELIIQNEKKRKVGCYAGKGAFLRQPNSHYSGQIPFSDGEIPPPSSQIPSSSAKFPSLL